MQNNFAYSPEDIAETESHLQRYNLQLPDGVTLDQARNLPGATMAWITKGKLALTTSTEIRLVSELFLHLVNDATVLPGLGKPNNVEIWKRLEHLTPVRRMPVAEEAAKIGLQHVLNAETVQRVLGGGQPGP